MKISPRQLFIRYTSFAIVAIAMNIGSQHIVLVIKDSLAIAILVGTAVGLWTKFILDKYWIFFDRPSLWCESARQFGLYILTGVFTTALFWGSEIIFEVLFRTVIMRDLGAALGLTIGYIAKYRLDKRFVFRGEAINVA